MKVDIAIKETKDHAGELEGIDDINSPEDEEWARIINEKFVHSEKIVTLRLKGGEGSGNFGHGGRPGEVGGSAPLGGMAPIKITGANTTTQKHINEAVKDYSHAGVPIDCLREIKVYGTKQELQIAYKKFGGTYQGQVGGFAQTQEGIIHICNENELSNSQIITHEIAHLVFARCIDEKLLDKKGYLTLWDRNWVENQRFDRFTEYSRTSPGEAFCETMSPFLSMSYFGGIDNAVGKTKTTYLAIAETLTHYRVDRYD